MAHPWRTAGLILLGVVVAALVILGFAAPTLAKNAINGAIARDPDYEGGVDAVTIDWLDLATAVHGVDVRVTAEGDTLRHVTADRLAIDLGAGSFTHLGALGTVVVEGFDAELAQPPEEAAKEASETVKELEQKEEEQQAQEAPTLAEQLADLPFFDLDVVVRGARLTWIDPVADASLVVDKVTGRIDHLTNRERGTTVARGVFSARIAEEGTASVQFTTDLTQDPLGGTVDLDVVGVPLAALNGVLRERLPVGFAEGTFTTRLNADYHPHTLADNDHEAWTYAGLDLRGLDFEGSAAVDDVRPVVTDLPGRDLSVPHAHVAYVWHPAEQDAITITGRVRRPKLEVTRSGAVALLGEEGPPKTPPAESPLLALPPFEVTDFRIEDGWVRFLDDTVAPEATIVIRDLNVKVEDLANRERGDRLAQVKVDGSMAGGELGVNVRLDPVAPTPTFTLDAELDHLHLYELQGALLAYSNLDVTRGTVTISTEVATANEAFDGYVKMTVDDLDVFSKRDFRKGLGAAWDALVGTGAEMIENQKKDRVGVRVPLRGQLARPDANVAQAVVSVLRNAFVRVMFPGLEGSIGLSDVEGT